MASNPNKHTRNMKAEAVKTITVHGKEVKITAEHLRRFWSKVDKMTNLNGCWEWTEGKSKGGYGIFFLHDGKMPAHRFSLVLKIGILEEGKFACHTCDNPSCVNPAHLWAGTASENMKDAVKKGRWKNPSCRGEKSAISKLSDQKVKEIRALYITGSIPRRELAVRYNVSHGAIQAVLERRTWAHVN